MVNVSITQLDAIARTFGSSVTQKRGCKGWGIQNVQPEFFIRRDSDDYAYSNAINRVTRSPPVRKRGITCRKRFVYEIFTPFSIFAELILRVFFGWKIF